ncbi:uncharacterized protein MYCFIDRAFT_175332 [Pseudocercospora fijiensis CIRAD86]|uniref:Uncharacterized protein n=1 Tax=Pseudocercospora fijiensis (strain CIRAD86) TaxID=383855 RepID=M2YVP5_PSEFD|nr:uncharacterized protein MYCFIDRAFT_175332 [Pseudocercospora fijiensis CIRAD86]EME81755.1 hypothetical protein MYCFIDRAFT_175332 [Pseudocercospora fijiensis CIRAD86]
MLNPTKKIQYKRCRRLSIPGMPVNTSKPNADPTHALHMQPSSQKTTTTVSESHPYTLLPILPSTSNIEMSFRLPLAPPSYSAQQQAQPSTSPPNSSNLAAPSSSIPHPPQSHQKTGPQIHTPDPNVPTSAQSAN